MVLMRWTQAMSVGVPELDADHQGLIDIINDLAVLGGPKAESHAVGACLKRLQRYALVHFGREEKIMTACGFPYLGVHQEEHRAFVLTMQGFNQSLQADPRGLAGRLADEILDYLKTWLNHHILLEDMAYKPFARERLADVRAAVQAFRQPEFHQSR